MLKFRKLVMLAAVAAIGLMAASCVVTVDVDWDAEVRFTWNSSRNNAIEGIYVSERDVRNWYNTYYKRDDATAVPRHDGSRDLPSNFALSRNGRYHGIADGSYTAVCAVYDRQYDIVWDIVANYRINRNTDYRFHEVAFDIVGLLNGSNDLGWYGGEYDRRSDAPIFRKVVEASEENGGTEVEFFVFRRPSK